MTFLQRLRKYFFHPYDDLMPALPPETKEEIPEAKRELIVGEPVKSLAASILEMTDWAVEEGHRQFSYHRDVQFRHKHKELDVRFRRHYGFSYDDKKPYPYVTCEMDWMTPDEKEFMVETSHEYFRLVEEEAERQRQIALAAEREKFMVLVK